MGMTTKYFSNTSNFKNIAEALRTANRLPDKIDGCILEQLGYKNPADELILNFFKELKLVRDDNTATSLFTKFRDPDHSKEAFALGVLEAYGDLFEQEPNIHLQSEENITKIFENRLGDEKSTIIINYMVSTFKVLVDYAGQEKLSTALEMKKAYESYFEGGSEDGDSVQTTGHSESEENKDVLAVEVEDQEQQKQPGTTQGDASSADSAVPKEINENAGFKNGTKQVNSDRKEDSINTATIEKVENGNQDEAFNGSHLNKKTSLNTDDMPRVSNSTPETEYINKAYIKKAQLLYKLDRYEEAFPAFDQVYQRFANSNNAELYEQASDALIKKMNTARELNLNNELVSIYSKIIERLGSSEDGKFAEDVDDAYMNLAEILLENNPNGKALEAIDQAIKRFKGTQRNTDFLARAMYQKAELYEQSGSDQEALEALEEFLGTFGS
ncbi:MAG: DUF5343 domain-containing protein [Fodinibius sp.]|nr:DUF5343 domain-containing protein [Fodinibius sp.]